MIKFLRRVPIGVRAVLVLILVLVVKSFFGSSHDGSSFTFTVANDRLFAIRSKGFYGSESGVWTTDDLGETWRVFNCPKLTRSLSGNGDVLLALTSSHEVWRREGAGEWKRLKTLLGSHHYEILCDQLGRFVVSGINSLSWHAPNGEQLRVIHSHGLDSDDVLFGKSWFADDSQTRLLVQKDPYTIAFVDLESGALTTWSDGLSSAPSNVSGPGRLCRSGENFLLGHYDGVFRSSGLLEPWHLLSDEFRHTEDFLNDEFCRDLAWYDERKDQWLIATDFGIKLMENAISIKDVFADEVLVDAKRNHVAADEHDLILQIVPFHDAYFVSFARLRNGAIGVRIPKDLGNWKTMRLTDPG